MLTGYQRKLTLSYAFNLRKTLKRTHPGAQDFVDWLLENALALGLEAPLTGSRSGDMPSTSDWRRLARVLDAARRAKRPTPPDPVARRLRQLGETIGLTRIDLAILEVLLYYETQPLIEGLVDAVFSGHQRGLHQPTNLRGDCLPCILAESAATIRHRFAPDAPLIRTGLVSVDEDQDLSVASRLRRLASVVPEALDVRQLLLGVARSSDLEWSDFDHLGECRDDVSRLLRGALDQGARGVNILVYGPPGTGKTEFCHVLARQIGADLFSVGETDDGGGEPTRGERLAELRLAQSLLRDDDQALLLFDEMEDLLSDFGGGLQPFLGLFGRRHRGGASKVFMNRLLEDAPAPTIWTTNEVHGINPAILRRMLFAVEMRQPPPTIRARIWSRQLAAHGIAASAEDARALAYEFDATPGVAAGATAAADLSDGGFDVVRRGVRSLSRVLGCDKPAVLATAHFDPMFAEADIDLADLTNRLAASAERRFSLCLQGPPGTGKSAFARHLADRLGLETLHKRASDLLSKYVGGTEGNIAAAFAQARDEGAFLVFDEADSLLADRRGANRNWEVSQVNEMLTWMESHPLPFACTTNYAERLDTAALRRFVFKATFRYLAPATVKVAFRAWFGVDAPTSLPDLRCVTPGDFDVVRRKASVLGKSDDRDALAAMLGTECDAKSERNHAIGFGG